MGHVGALLGERPICAGVLVPHAEEKVGVAAFHGKTESQWVMAGGQVVGRVVLSKTRVATREAEF